VPNCPRHFSTGAEVSSGHFGTSAKMWDISVPNTWCRNVLGPKCLRSEVSVHRRQQHQTSINEATITRRDRIFVGGRAAPPCSWLHAPGWCQSIVVGINQSVNCTPLSSYVEAAISATLSLSHLSAYRNHHDSWQTWSENVLRIKLLKTTMTKALFSLLLLLALLLRVAGEWDIISGPV